MSDKQSKVVKYPKISKALREQWRTGVRTGHSFSAKSRKKMRMSHLGVPLLQSHRENIGKSLLGKKRSPLTAKTKNKIRRTLKRKHASGELVSPMKGKKHTAKSNLQNSENRKGKCLGNSNPAKRPAVRKKISKKLKGRVFSKEWINNIRSARLQQRLPVKDTSIEVKMQQVLKENSIKFKKHEPLLNKYQVDILIEPNLIIECDGNYWHNYPDGLDADRKRDANLKNAGYQVVRFWESDINNNLNACFDKIQKCLI